MTDKEPIDKMIELSEDLGLYEEQIKDSLKKTDKNFNENFTQEKEQIIIDIDKYFKSVTDDSGRLITYVVNHNNLRKEIITLNENYARKEQKYELLVRTNKTHIDMLDQLNNKYIDLEQECDCYRDALEEIRKIIASQDVGTRPKLYDFEQDSKILNIISKVKGKGNE